MGGRGSGELSFAPLLWAELRVLPWPHHRWRFLLQISHCHEHGVSPQHPSSFGIKYQIRSCRDNNRVQPRYLFARRTEPHPALSRVPAQQPSSSPVPDPAPRSMRPLVASSNPSTPAPHASHHGPRSSNPTAASSPPAGLHPKPLPRSEEGLEFR